MFRRLRPPPGLTRTRRVLWLIATTVEELGIAVTPGAVIAAVTAYAGAPVSAYYVFAAVALGVLLVRMAA